MSHYYVLSKSKQFLHWHQYKIVYSAEKGSVGLHDFYLILKCCLIQITCFSSGGYIMLWRVLYVILAACFTLGGHDTPIDFLWFLFLVSVICPLMQEHFL